MKQFSIQHYSKSAYYALLSSVMIVAMLFIGFFLAEPSISYGQSDTGEFTITQTITGETSFSVKPTDVTMSGSIQGLTGGHASGTTDFEVTSNSTSGYYVEIQFENNGWGGSTMLGDTTDSVAIKDYLGDNSGEPSYGYVDNAASQFAYTVTSDLAGDTDPSFLNDGTNCNTGGDQNGTASSTKCWKAPDDSSPFRIVEKNGPAASGAGSTIEFDVLVPSNANPLPQSDTYTATATLTLITQ